MSHHFRIWKKYGFINAKPPYYLYGLFNNVLPMRNIAPNETICGRPLTAPPTRKITRIVMREQIWIWYCMACFTNFVWLGRWRFDYDKSSWLLSHFCRWLAVPAIAKISKMRRAKQIPILKVIQIVMKSCINVNRSKIWSVPQIKQGYGRKNNIWSPCHEAGRWVIFLSLWNSSQNSHEQ